MGRTVEFGLAGAERVPVRFARATWAAFVRSQGYRTVPRLLLSEGNRKLALAEGVKTFGLTLSPAFVDTDGGRMVTCPMRTRGCERACVLSTAGNARYLSVQRARRVRTLFAVKHPNEFVTLVALELREAHARYGSALRVRLNVASDIRWERVPVVAAAMRDIGPGVFYDYTKWSPSQRDDMGGIYRLVYSVSERRGSLAVAKDYVAAGGTAAVVLDVRRGRPLPVLWEGFAVVDGDASDDRTVDVAGAWVGLRAKGAGVKDTTGFVRAV